MKKRGRPPQGRVTLHVQVHPNTRDFLDERSAFCGSLGKVVDDLVILALALKDPWKHFRNEKCTCCPVHRAEGDR